MGPRARKIVGARRLGALCLIVFFALLKGGEARASRVMSSGEMFSHAREAFQAGDYPRSQAFLRALLKKYPGFKPAWTLWGRIAYRSGDFRRAASLFERAGADSIDAQVGLEWGLAFYALNRCDQALKGFSRVTAPEANRSLARFYAGSCYLKRGNWDRAEYYMSSARELPADLAASRRKVLADLRQRRQQRSMAYSPYVPMYLPPPPPMAGYYGMPYMGGPPPKAGEKLSPGAAATPPAAASAPPRSGFSISATPSVTSSMSSSSADYSGYKVERGSVSKLAESLSLHFQYDARARANGTQPSFSLDLKGSAEQSWSEGTSIQYQVTEDDPSNIMAKETVTPEDYAQSSGIKIKPGASLPLSSHLSLDVSYTYQDSYPDANIYEKSTDNVIAGGLTADIGAVDVSVGGNQATSSDKYGVSTAQSTGANAGITIAGETVSLSTSGEYNQNINVKTDGSALGTWDNVVTGDMTLKRSFESGSFSASGGTVMRTAPTGEQITSKPATEYSLGVALDTELFFGLNGSGSLAYVMKEDWLLVGTAEEGKAAPTSYFGATEIQAGGSVSAAPTGWMTLKASYNYSKVDWVVDDVKLLQTVQLARPDLSSNWTLSMNLSTSF